MAPWRSPYRTASSLERTSSFMRMLLTWLWTVSGVSTDPLQAPQQGGHVPGRQHQLTLAGPDEYLDQPVDGLGLGHEPGGSGADDPVEDVGGLQRGHHHHLRLRTDVAQLRRGLDAV